MAVVDQWTGRLACLLQSAAGATNERWANWLGVAVRTVAYWHSRPDTVLGSTNQELLTVAHDRLPEPARERFRRMLAGGEFPAGEEPVRELSVAAAMQAFRAADQKVGGAHLYATVVNYLHAEVAPRLFGGTGDGQELFTAAAGLTEMAGWMAHDAGRDLTCGQHFTRALDLSHVGGDRQLGAHILASMSHLSHHLKRPAEAIQLAERGQSVLRGGGPAQPDLEARLLAMQARGFAALGDAAQCGRLLARAEAALDLPAGDEPSRWISGFDEGSLASEAARCMRDLGQLSEAERHAGRIIELRPADRTRSRALGQLLLATVLVAKGEPEQACTVVRGVLDATRALSSGFVVQQILDMRHGLEAYGDVLQVANFLACLDAEAKERLWLYQALASNGHEPRAEA